MLFPISGTSGHGGDVTRRPVVPAQAASANEGSVNRGKFA